MVRAASRAVGKPDLLRVRGAEEMSGGARKDEDQGSPPASEAALSARLKRLDERLAEAGANRGAEANGPDRGRVDPSAWARGFRLSSEFVAAILVGAGLGFLVDHYLRVSPGGLIVFTLLGFAAGVLNLMRANTPRAPESPDSPTQRRPD
jgi:ATP synthase protein I